MRKTAPFLSATLLLAGFCFAVPGFCFADSFNPGDQIVATFTAAPNAADMLLFFNNDPLTVSGAPVLSLTLYDGGTSVATVVAPPYSFGSPTTTIFAGDFQSLTSPWAVAVPKALIDFTSINNGTIAGTLVWTISGGSLSGFTMSDFVLYDANSCGSACYTPENDISSQINLQSVPEPSSLLLFTAGMALLGAACFRKRDAYKTSRQRMDSVAA